MPRATFAMLLCGLATCGAACSTRATAPSTCAPDWPMPNPPGLGLPNQQSYGLDQDDVVLDRITGLTWQRRVDTAGYDWASSSPVCAALVLGGFDDWRMPTLVELVSLVDFARTDPAIDPIAFPDTPALPFWAAQTDATNRGLAWYVYFRNGGAYGGNDIVDVQRIRCVRGHHLGETGACVQSAGGIVTQTRSGLAWQALPDSTDRDWNEAAAYCASLDLQGNGWRLPSLNELMTIVDVARVEPSIDPQWFPNTPAELFWTGSRVAGSTDTSWGVSFNKGSAAAAPRNFPYQVRCVRESGALATGSDLPK